MNRFSIMIVEVVIFIGVLVLKIYMQKRRLKKIKCIEMRKKDRNSI